MPTQNLQLIQIKKSNAIKNEFGELDIVSSIGETSVRTFNKKLRGVDSLIQLFVFHMFSANDGVLSNGDVGTPLPILAGSVNIDNIDEIKISIGIAIYKVRTDILRTQSENIDNIDDDSKLHDLKIKEIETDSNSGTINISVVLKTVSGKLVDLTQQIFR